jgi:hypothetical protein
MRSKNCFFNDFELGMKEFQGIKDTKVPFERKIKHLRP